MKQNRVGDLDLPRWRWLNVHETLGHASSMTLEALSIPGGHCRLAEEPGGVWTVSVWTQTLGPFILNVTSSSAEAQEIAQNFAAEHGGDDLHRRTSWREHPASDAQEALAKRRGITVPIGPTKGELSDLIVAHQAWHAQLLSEVST